jgi:SPP1 family predicted phage head-tail adaptor
MIQAGKLRHLVRIETKTSSRSADYGDIVHTWTLLGEGEVYAGIEPISGRERWEANAVTADITHRIYIRYHSQVTATMRIIFGSRTFYIESVRNLSELDDLMEILAKEEV